MGIIDTLSEGFNRVRKRLWLIVIPILLDIGIWTGPRLSVNNLSKRVLATLPNVTELGDQYQQSLLLAREWLADLGERTNLLSLLSMRLWGLSTLTGVIARPAPFIEVARRVVEVQSWPMLIGTVALLGLVSLLIGCFYLSLIAQQVRDETVDIVHALQVAWRSWVRLGALTCVVLLIAAMATGGVIIFSSMVALLNPGLSALALNVFILTLLWISVYSSVIFFFTTRAVVLDDAGVLRCVWSSLNVVHRNLFSTIGFIVLISIIESGLLYIWRVLAVKAVGTVVSIVGNAYVSTGLVMASFIFYRDRFVAWQEAKV